MSDSPVFSDYVAGLRTLLESTPTRFRSGEAVRPAAPYTPDQIEEARRFLEQSRSVESDLVEQWRQALDAYERSRAELRLLAAAAADLAIAERLARAVQEEGVAGAALTGTTSGVEPLILRALHEPEKLLAPGRLPPYRATGQEAMLLQAAISECLRFIHDETVEVTRDAIEGFLTMDAAILKEAAEALGADISYWLNKLAEGALETAVHYVLAATDKIRAVLGPRADEMIRDAMFEFIDNIHESALIGHAVERFLNTNGTYQEGRHWILAYRGEPAVLGAVADEVMALQGSFSGRAKITTAIIRGLAVVKLLKPLTIPPWGPLGVTAAYLTVTGYLFFSAHDHVDSDRYAFFDRVRGVRGALLAELDVPRFPQPRRV